MGFVQYRARLRETLPPALPYLGSILTDLTFCNDGNADTRPSPLAPDKQLVNMSKYYGLARIIDVFERFQAPYALAEVPEAQMFLERVSARLEYGHQAKS